jgi:hypothetical protein
LISNQQEPLIFAAVSPKVPKYGINTDHVDKGDTCRQIGQFENSEFRRIGSVLVWKILKPDISKPEEPKWWGTMKSPGGDVDLGNSKVAWLADVT